jgi:hypothetical protein
MEVFGQICGQINGWNFTWTVPGSPMPFIPFIPIFRYLSIFPPRGHQMVRVVALPVTCRRPEPWNNSPLAVRTWEKYVQIVWDLRRLKWKRRWDSGGCGVMSLAIPDLSDKIRVDWLKFIKHGKWWKVSETSHHLVRFLVWQTEISSLSLTTT